MYRHIVTMSTLFTVSLITLSISTVTDLGSIDVQIQTVLLSIYFSLVPKVVAEGQLGTLGRSNAFPHARPTFRRNWILSTEQII